MLAINNLSFHFGGRTLYDEASLHIKPKDRIGLVGANGTGKSTLLRIITGEYLPDGGTVSKANDCSLGFLNQDLLSYQTTESILSVAMQAFERAVYLEKEIEIVLAEMETEYTDELLDKLTKYQEEFERLDGYTMRAKTEAVLEGLGFATKDLERPLKEFSGGWRMRVMLAKLLLQKPALLMLDEPTNHLDMPSIQWIEGYLENYEGATIVVSHDRQFLDNVCNIIVEVSQQKLNLYSGNYTFFQEEKAMRNEIQKSSFENQQAQIRQTERFIERFKAKASKARQVQSKVKSLDRIDMIDDVIAENAKVNFRFTFQQASGRYVVKLDNVSKSYGDNHILKHTSVSIERGDKIALIGANGKGKSTLLRVIAGTEQVQGLRIEGHNVIQTFFAQHQLEALRVDNDLITELKEAGSGKLESELRGVLGCFLFSGDEVFKKIKVLSGGEKSRVALAKTLISEANFLLLDEPTNHLDMQSVNILIQALVQYEGTFVLVSHDRYFVENVANKIWYIEDYQIKEYSGTYEEYEYWRKKNEEEAKTKNAADKTSEKSVEKIIEKPKNQTNNNNNSTSFENKEKAKKLQKELEIVELRISELEKEKATFEKQLSDSNIYNDNQKLKATNESFHNAKNQLDKSQQEWEKIALEIDKL